MARAGETQLPGGFCEAETEQMDFSVKKEGNGSLSRDLMREELETFVS